MKQKVYVFRDEGIEALKEIRQKTKTTNQKYDLKYSALWNKYVKDLAKLIESSFEGNAVKVLIHPLAELEEAKRKLAGNNLILSLDSYFSVNNKTEFSLGVSRIFKPSGKEKIGIGNRPGYKPLVDQLKKISSEHKGKQFVLIEDDIFSGGTLNEIIKLAEQYGIKIVKIIAGLQVAEKLQTTVPVFAVHKYSPYDILELNDPRDFLCGTYEGGLVIEYPNGERVRAPYILPFVDVTQRASIPEAKNNEFSKKLIQINKDLYHNLEKELGIELKIKHLSPSFQNFLKLEAGITSEDKIQQAFDLYERKY